MPPPLRSDWDRVDRFARFAPARNRVHSVRAADPTGLSEARAGRRHLRAVHGPPAVLPQPAGGRHAMASGARDAGLWIDLRPALRVDPLGIPGAPGSLVRQ